MGNSLNTDCNVVCKKRGINGLCIEYGCSNTNNKLNDSILNGKFLGHKNFHLKRACCRKDNEGKSNTAIPILNSNGSYDTKLLILLD